jgi:hypothetical protein
MAQDLTVNIKTTSDVPQAMDKAKSATAGFGKQVEDIQKKFSTSFKDIFLSFLGPMALVTGAIALIGKLIADNQRRQDEATQAAIDGTNELMSAEDRYWNRKTQREKKAKETVKEAETARQLVTQQFLENDPRGKEMAREYKKGPGKMMLTVEREMAKLNSVQSKVQAIIAEDRKNDPVEKSEEAKRKQKEAEELAKKEEAAAKAAAALAKKDASQMTIPSSVSGNVIGVGANPVVTALQEQQAIARAQLTYLEIIAAQFGYAATYKDVTASGATPQTPANASPNKAAILTKNK